MARTEAILRDERGMALVMTLLIISFLVALTMQLMVTTDQLIASSAQQREQVRLDGMVLGGLNLLLAAMQLDQEANTVDSPHDTWATFDTEALQAITEDVELTIKVDDLSGRLSINALAEEGNQAFREIWIRFLLCGHFAVKDRDQAEALVDALVDWLDEDDEELAQGAEGSYYQGLETPYGCRNGKMAHVEELLLVKGMTPAIVYGDEEHEGIFSSVTVADTEGKINLNFAPVPVLLALSADMTDKLAQELITYREDEENEEKLGQTDWYRKVGGFPTAIDLDSQRLTVQSSYFQVRITATLHQFHRTGIGVVHRADKALSMVSWQVE